MASTISIETEVMGERRRGMEERRGGEEKRRGEREILGLFTQCVMPAY